MKSNENNKQKERNRKLEFGYNNVDNNSLIYSALHINSSEEIFWNTHTQEKKKIGNSRSLLLDSGCILDVGFFSGIYSVKIGSTMWKVVLGGLFGEQDERWDSELWNNIQEI